MGIKANRLEVIKSNKLNINASDCCNLKIMSKRGVMVTGESKSTRTR